MQVSTREGESWCEKNSKVKSKGQVQGRGAKQVEFKVVARLRLRCMTVPVVEQDSDKGRFQVQGTDNTVRFKVHSSAGGVHGRDKGMLEVQDKFDVQCSRGTLRCHNEVRVLWQCKN